MQSLRRFRRPTKSKTQYKLGLDPKSQRKKRSGYGDATASLFENCFTTAISASTS